MSESPMELFLAVLCSAAMAWSLYLLAWYRHGPARLLVVASGLIGFSASLSQFQAIGIWSRNVDPRLAGIANVSALLVCLAALGILWRGTSAFQQHEAACPQPVQQDERAFPVEEIERKPLPTGGSGAARELGKDASPTANDWNGDRRKRFRAPIDGRISVEVLAPVQMQVCGQAADFSGDGIGLRLKTAIPVRGIVVVRAEETLLLGQVAYCRQDEDGEFRAGLSIEHFLAGQTNRPHSQRISRATVSA